MKRRNIIRLFSCLLACIFIFLGAGNVKSEGEREMDGNMYLTGLPIVEEQESFTLFVDDSGLAEEKIMYPILEEQTNVKVELMLYPYETATEKLNILLNGNDYPDVIGGWILSSNDIVKNGMRDQLYIPLEEYFTEESTPNIMDVLEETNVRRAMTLPDGHIYSIPYIIGTPLVNFLPFINKVWLDNVGMDVPNTPEELKEVLIAFRDNDPNQNGEKDEIPFSADPNNRNLHYLAGWWGDSMEGSYMTLEDGELAFKANSEGYKEMIKYLADLYAEGLIDPEIFTQDLSTWKGKGAQNLYGVSMAYGSGDFYELDKTREDLSKPGDFVYLPVLKGVENPNYARGSYGATIFRNQVVVTDKCENPAVVARWFDNVFTLENSIQIQGGLFGKRLENLGDGVTRTIPDSEITEEDRAKYDWANMFTQSLPKYVPLGYKSLPPEGVPENYEEKDPADEAYEPFLTEMVPSVWYNDEQSRETSIIETDLNEFIEQKQAQWISGQTDVEAEWDDYVAKLDELGLPRLLEIKGQLVKDALAVE